MFWPTRILSIIAALAGCFLIERVAHMLPGGDYIQRIVALAGLYVVLAVSLNLINGITGQFSIGHAAFYQIGAYVGGFVTDKFYGHWGGIVGVPWLFLVMFIGAGAAGIAGFIVGLPSLRLRGDYLAIVTLGFGEIIRIVVQNVDAVGGSYGLNTAPKFIMIWPIWLLAICCIATCRNLLKSAHGLPFLAVREDEVAALAMGVNVTKTKVTSFVIASMFAGAAGVLLAHYEGFITPVTFSMDVSFMILTMVVLGGTGSTTGSVVAAILLSYLPEYLRGLKDAHGQALVVTGASIVAALVATVVYIVITKRVMEMRLEGVKRNLAYVGCLIAAIIAKIAFTPLLTFIKPMAEKQVEMGQLRMVIFATALIAIMLLRPQGIFAHHEFSWDWLKKLFTRKEAKPAVSA